ncbi:aminotransferase class I/II-fold pyridoxal phosphate-dependent enzyme [Geomicrobium sp. JCM 19037]|uniref:aminotransferase class I/II-fold pyridoxal phosphate-dependent enzyme n=1 Tax=Geomicrobium sp. JCM 19037 TaxID=1460634 RepID=UPI0005AB03E9|nr:aminotransferase class I/II-fold pyridoxal phosphate-dependent enzyme [Geomicrobium sp. JCM 19037]
MLPTIAKRMNDVQFSKIRELSEKARQLDASGVPVYSLTLGEPDFDTPEPAQKAAINAMRDGDTHYTPNHGIPALREALAQKLLNDNGIRAEADEIIVTAGGSEAVLNTLLAILNPGDEVLIPSRLGRTTSLLPT